MKNIRLRAALLGLGLGAALGLAACGGGGGEAAATLPKLDCTPVAGLSDPLGDAVATQLVPALTDLPQFAEPAVGIARASARLLDTADALTQALQVLLTTQSASLFSTEAARVGDSLVCFSREMSAALIALNQAGQGSPLGQLPGLADALVQLEALQQTVQAGLDGRAPGGNLTALTDQLAALSLTLGDLSTQLAQNAPEVPVVGPLLFVPQQMLGDLARTLDAVGRLDADDTADGIVALFSEGFGGLALAGALGAGLVPEPALQNLVLQAGQVVDVFRTGSGLLLTPLFTALSAVLGPVTGPDAPFADVLLGGLAGTPIGGLPELLAGGGSTADGTAIPELSQLLSGLPLLGDLLSALSGGAAPGGIAGLLAVLDPASGLPALSELLAQIPGINGGQPLALPLVGELLDGLLALDPGGVPVIVQRLGSLLSGAGAPDLAQISAALNNLLGLIFGGP